KPTDIINGPSGAEGPSEVRYRAHVAFSTVNDLLNNLNSVTNRRKALIYVSDGYDFNPFQEARLGLMDPNSPFAQNEFARSQNQMAAQNNDGTGNSSQQTDPMANQQKQSETFVDAETSDYYVLGYYSKNPDIMKRRRQIEVKVTRKNANAWFRKEYVLKPLPAPSSSTKK